MCELDWSALGTVLSGIGAIASTGLAVWLIRVTIRYVKINAEILATTREALAISAGLLETTRDTLRATQQQLADQRVERIGPVAAAVQDRLRSLRRWQAWLDAPRQHYGQMVNLKHEFLPPEFESSRLTSSKLSLSAYNEISLAKQAIELFAATVAEVQHPVNVPGTTVALSVDEQISTLTSGRDFVNEAIEHLENAYRTFSSDAAAG